MITQTRLWNIRVADEIGKKDGQVLMIKNNGQVEAYQVRMICNLRSYVVADLSGPHQQAHGSRSAKWWMQSGQAESSYTKAKSTIMSSMWMLPRGYRL